MLQLVNNAPTFAGSFARGNSFVLTK